MSLLFSAYFRLFLPVLLLLAFSQPAMAATWAATLVLAAPAWLLWCLMTGQ